MCASSRYLSVLIAVATVLFFGFFFVPHVHSAEVTLAWKANINPAVVGYNLYYGATSRKYDVRLDVGKELKHTVTGLVPGKKYYFAATTYTAMSESKYSEERAYTVPVTSTSAVLSGTMSESTTPDLSDPSATDIKAVSDPFVHSLTLSTKVPHPHVWLGGSRNGMERDQPHSSDSSMIEDTREILYPSREGHMAQLTFEVPATGDYVLWIHRKTDGSTRNSVLLSMDDGNGTSWNASVSATGAWAWERANEPEGAQPSWFHLETGIHTLAIEPLEGGVSIDRILISSAPDFIPRTVYENGQKAASWLSAASNSKGSGTSEVFDEERWCTVVQLSGSNTRDRFLLGATGPHRWRNNKQFVLEWSMRCSDPFAAEVLVRTTAGFRTIQYLPADNLQSRNENFLQFGLGEDVRNDRWHKVIRDLQSDVSLLEPGVRIIEVNGFVFRGSGKVGEVLLRDF